MNNPCEPLNYGVIKWLSRWLSCFSRRLFSNFTLKIKTPAGLRFSLSLHINLSVCFLVATERDQRNVVTHRPWFFFCCFHQPNITLMRRWLTTFHWAGTSQRIPTSRCAADIWKYAPFLISPDNQSSSLMLLRTHTHTDFAAGVTFLLAAWRHY